MPAAVVKTPSAIKSLCWNADDTEFALSEENMIFVRDADTSLVSRTLPFYNTLSLMFSKEGGAGRDVLLALSAEGTMDVWNLSEIRDRMSDTGEPSYNVSFDEGGHIVCTAFSNSSDSIAAGMDNNSVFIYFKLRYTHQLISKELAGHDAPVYSLAFSPNNMLLASASEDGRIIVWDASGGLELARLGFWSGSHAPVLFTADSQSVICTTDAHTVSVVRLDGEVLRTFTVGDGISSLCLLHDGRTLVVQTGKDNLEFYRLSDSSYYGYIPPYNTSRLTSFAFSSDDGMLLAGHEDGSVYKLRVHDVFLEPGELPPQVRLVAADEVVVRGSAHSNSGIGRDGGEEGKDKTAPAPEHAPLQGFIYVPKENIIEAGMTGVILPSPYAAGLGADICWKNSERTAPFYFGAGFKGLWGFPSGDFPYEYTIGGSSADSPYLLSAALYAPAGISMMLPNPFFHVWSEASLGVRISSLTDARNVSSKPCPSFMCSLMTGIGMKYADIAAGVEYDTVLGFVPEIMLSGRIGLPKISKSSVK